MINPPFIRAFAIETDLSITGINNAVGLWKHNYDSVPSILWVHPKEYAWANRLVDEAFRHLTVLTDPHYDEDAWSVGTRTDRGFGSIGA